MAVMALGIGRSGITICMGIINPIVITNFMALQSYCKRWAVERRSPIRGLVDHPAVEPLAWQMEDSEPGAGGSPSQMRAVMVITHARGDGDKARAQ